MTTVEDNIAYLRQWFRDEADGLPRDAQRMVLRTLEDKNLATGCMSLVEMERAGSLPAAWKSP